MKDLKNLLNQVSTIVKKNNEILDATGGRFNMFKILGVDHYETTHSAILAEFLNPKGSHGLKELFLKAFIDNQIKYNLESFNEFANRFDYENARTYKEFFTSDGGRIDILIEDKRGHAIIIENKIYAEDQWKQLKRYDEFALRKYLSKENYRIFYLTLNGTKASENSGEGVDYIQISHSEYIIQWLEQCLSLSVRYPFVRETINQYIDHIKKLTNQDMDKIYQEELVNLLAKSENIESAIKISMNVQLAKSKIVANFANRVAEKSSLKCEVSTTIGFGFFKEEWKKGSGIWFALHNGKTYYSIKTPEARNCKAVPQFRIEELFSQKAEACNPFGFGYALDDHWENNSQLYLNMIDDSLAEESIIPYLLKVLDYLEKHPEIENQL